MKCVVWYFRYKCVVSYLCNVGLGSEDVCGSVLEESPLRSSCSGGAHCLLLVQLCLAFVVCPVRSYVTLFIVLLIPSTGMQPVLGCGMHLGRTAPAPRCFKEKLSAQCRDRLEINVNCTLFSHFAA